MSLPDEEDPTRKVDAYKPPGLVIAPQVEVPEEEDRTLLVSAARPRRRWRFWLGGAVVVALLAVAATRLELPELAQPPPPEPVRLPSTETGMLPPAPPPNPAAAPNQLPSPELMARKEALEPRDVPSVERSRRPELRSKERSIAPKAITRKPTGRSANKGVGQIYLIATFLGKPIKAPVEVDGRWRGNTPLALTLSAGAHAIRIDHRRTRVNEFVTEIEGGKSLRMEVELRPISEPKKKRPSRHATRKRR